MRQNVLSSNRSYYLRRAPGNTHSFPPDLRTVIGLTCELSVPLATRAERIFSGTVEASLHNASPFPRASSYDQ